MRYHALACDYDGTIAHDGKVDDATVAALERLRETGRRVILVTGRQLDDLKQVFPEAGNFRSGCGGGWRASLQARDTGGEGARRAAATRNSRRSCAAAASPPCRRGG